MSRRLAIALPIFLAAAPWLTATAAPAEKALPAKPAAPATDTAAPANSSDAVDAAANAETSPAADENTTPALTAEMKQRLFDDAYRAARRGRWASAADRFYVVLNTFEKGTTENETALYFLAKSFERLNLHQAATEYYYEVVRHAGNADFITDAIRFMESTVGNLPYDEDLIMEDLLATLELGFLPPELQDFIQFYQGVRAYKMGTLNWAKLHFLKLRPGTYYAYRVQFIDAVEMIKRNQIDRAMKRLQAIIDADFPDFNLRNEARQTMARIQYERKKYNHAYALYRQMDSPLWTQSTAFLEKGWSSYMAQNRQQSLGDLLPLQAPMFSGFFAPDAAVIQTLVYKELCHYDDALGELGSFRERYGPSVKMIRERDDLTKSPILMDAIFWRPELKRRYDFLEALHNEEKRANRMDWAEPLKTQVARLYQLKIRETERRLQDDMQDHLRAVAEKLLDFDEQMNLLNYEVKLEQLRRIKLFEKGTIVESHKIPLVAGDTIYWPFEGEFWSDEFLDYQSMLDNRCLGKVVR